MKGFKKQTIKVQILTAYLLIIVLIPIIINFSYKQINSLMIKQNTQYNKEIASLLKQRISSNSINIKKLMLSIGYDSTVQSFLIEEDKLKTYELVRKVDSILSVAKNTYDGILDIIIVNSSGKATSISGNVNTAYSIRNSLGETGVVDFFGSMKIDNFSYTDTFVYGMNILSGGQPKPVGQKIGFITILLDVKSINREIEKLPGLSSTNIYLMDNKGRLLTSNNSSNLILDEDTLTKLQNNDEGSLIHKTLTDSYVMQIYNIPEIEGKLITAVPIKALTKDLGEIKFFSFILVIITLVIVFAPFSFVIMNILTPLNKLTIFMKKIKNRNLNLLKSRVDLEGYAEIEAISDEFNSMLSQLNSLTDNLVETTTKLYKTEVEKKQAEIAYVQSQINPHFLYNTLDTIKGIALVKGVKEVYEMSAALSAIFRYSIKGSDEVMLKEELKIIGSYTKIQQIRFSDRIAFEIICPEDIKDLIIPKMILQPLVENAVYHGLEPLIEGGILKITVQKNGSDLLEIHIVDNGLGIPPDSLEELCSLLMKEEAVSLKATKEHIGLTNVNNRIKLKYGKQYGLTINSIEGKGTDILLSLPVVKTI